MDIPYSPTNSSNNNQRIILVKKKYVIKGVRIIKKYK